MQRLFEFFEVLRQPSPCFRFVCLAAQVPYDFANQFIRRQRVLVADGDCGAKQARIMGQRDGVNGIHREPNGGTGQHPVHQDEGFPVNGQQVLDLEPLIVENPANFHDARLHSHFAFHYQALITAQPGKASPCPPFRAGFPVLVPPIHAMPCQPVKIGARGIRLHRSFHLSLVLGPVLRVGSYPLEQLLVRAALDSPVALVVGGGEGVKRTVFRAGVFGVTSLGAFPCLDSVAGDRAISGFVLSAH